jgi:hypothetical protein
MGTRFDDATLAQADFVAAQMRGRPSAVGITASGWPEPLAVELNVGPDIHNTV